MTWSKQAFFGRTAVHYTALALTTMVVGGVAEANLSATGLQVSQKGRAFQPGELSVRLGDHVRIVNDDADLLHHAYIDSDSFSFDSGDQEPGSTAEIVFSVAGDFKVLCGIHPKMKMQVHVAGK